MLNRMRPNVVLTSRARLMVRVFTVLLAIGRQSHIDQRVAVDDAQRVGKVGFFQRSERHAFAFAARLRHGGVVATHDDILRRAHQRLAIGRAENVVRRKHQRVRFDLGFNRQRQVNRHLVTIEVRVETFARQRVQVNRVTFNENRLKRHDSHAVKRWGSVQHHRMIGDDRFENIPNFFIFAFEHLLRALDGIGVAEFFELANDERLVKFQRDLLGQTTVVKLQSRPDHDHTACGIIDTFTKQVFAETTLLTFDHVRQRFERTVAATKNRSLATVVVEQRVDRLLQHPLLVANDDLRSVEIDQFSQAVVTVDNAAVEIVEIARRKVARVQQDERVASPAGSRGSRREPSTRACCHCRESLRRFSSD